MATSSTEQLKEQIESIPTILRQALERQAKARIEVARIEAQVDKLEAEIAREGGPNDDDNLDEGDDLEDDLALLKLESKLERLKLEVTEAEDKAELEFRESASKTTEGLVKAAVGNDPNVIRLRRECLEAKEAARIQKITLQRERQAAREAKLEARRVTRVAVEPENAEVSALQERLMLAQDEVILADVEVDVTQAMIETYKMLVQLA